MAQKEAGRLVPLRICRTAGKGCAEPDRERVWPSTVSRSGFCAGRADEPRQVRSIVRGTVLCLAGPACPERRTGTVCRLFKALLLA